MDRFDRVQKKIAIDCVRNPIKALICGPYPAAEAERILKDKFSFSDKRINNLKKD